MKNFTILFAALLMFLGACKKENKADCNPTDKFSLADALVVSKGTLVFNSLTKTSGVAKIYLQKNGRYLLALEQVNVHSPSDLSVYLSKMNSCSGGSSGAIELFSFKDISGEK